MNKYEAYKNRLKQNLTKKFKTTMIGAISSIEQSEFGRLFGYGKDDSELTENELRWKQEWEQIRTDILNKGNSQLRSAIEELSCYQINYNGYRTSFIIKRDKYER